MNERQGNTEDGSRQTTILVVEDSMVQAELLRRILAREGYRVTLAKDGAEGLAAARKEPPKVIISDITMPVMDGFEMCKAIRRDAALMDIPVILLTMLTDARDVIHGLNAGADYYVTKPFNEQYLLSKIKAAMTGKHWCDEKKMEMELDIGDEKHVVNAGSRQVMNLLVSTYENAVLQNRELMAAQDQLKEFAERLEKKARELEDVNQELEGFAYSVSHDLRMPLRAIDGFSSMVMKQSGDKLDDEGRRLLNVVRDNTKRMGQLIDDILAFSRAGRLEIKAVETDMEALVREVWQDIEPSIAGREVRLDIKPLPKAQGDPAMLRQVWANLLGNAAKFTSLRATAHIEVGGTLGLAANGEGDVCTFYVKDDGAGFDMQYADKLFGVFQRLHENKEFEGTGIGLAIVKRIVVRHGGRVWAEGKVDEGAAFYFSLPKG